MCYYVKLARIQNIVAPAVLLVKRERERKNGGVAIACFLFSNLIKIGITTISEIPCLTVSKQDAVTCGLHDAYGSLHVHMYFILLTNFLISSTSLSAFIYMGVWSKENEILSKNTNRSDLLIFI